MKELAKIAFKQWKEKHELEKKKLDEFFHKKYSEEEFNSFLKNFNSIFQMKAKTGGFQEALENYTEQYEKFILNKEEIK